MIEHEGTTGPKQWRSPTQNQLNYVSTWFDFRQPASACVAANQAADGECDAADATSLSGLLAVYECLDLLDCVWPQENIDDTVDADHGESHSSRVNLVACGDVIDSRFRLVAELGRGGFGVVFRGFDMQLRRDVAIKIAHAHAHGISGTSATDRAAAGSSNQPGAAIRNALQEAQLVAGLRHENIVRVIDVGSSSQVPFYIVSEFIEGQNLSETTRGGRLPLADALRISASIAEALDHAHDRGIIHLDVKPANILLDPNGKPHLTDFGLAENHATFYRTNRIVGTPQYMSPELAAGRNHRISRQCDIYSLGVTLYYLLSGRLPFRGRSLDELLQRIAVGRYPPVSQLVQNVPPRLEHILERAMARRQSDRYQTAGQLAADLHSVVHTLSRKQFQVEAVSTVRIVPQGLRAFTGQDSEFFAELLPGVRDVSGVPARLRLWKHKLEGPPATADREVSLIFGPSGCGKSSFVKAGLIPILSRQIISIYVEATPDTTEKNLLTLIRQHVDLPATVDTLADAVRWLQNPARDGQSAGDGLCCQRWVIFIDQFEQWLHHRHLRHDQGLATALASCDGKTVMPVLIVRDDFWMSISRFMNELDIPIVEGENAAAIDLFDLDHACRVLQLFGQANGDLPADASRLTAAQHEFIRLAIDDLQSESRIVCVRIALFAQMMRGRDWSPKSLERLGGSIGIGERFLEETFGDRAARANHRAVAAGARRVLAALMPPNGDDIKGQLRTLEELREICQPGNDDFERLVQVLDKELRLITLAEPGVNVVPVATAASPAPAPASSAQASSAQGQPSLRKGPPVRDCGGYRLTHDFLVPSIREWLSRKQRQTAVGRAELCLAERTSLWQSDPSNRYLPSALETIAILRRTHSARWSSVQKKMMTSAVRIYARRLLVTAVALSLFVAGSFWLRSRILAQQFRTTAAGKVDSLLTARIADVPRLIDELRDYRWVTEDRLLATYHTSQSADEKLHAALALAGSKHADLKFIKESLLNGNAAQVRVIRQIAQQHRLHLAPLLWQDVQGGLSATQFLAAASGLAVFSPQDSGWSRITNKVADALVRENAVAVAGWMELLKPVAEKLNRSLASILRRHDGTYSAAQCDVATAVLAQFAADDPQLVFELMVDSPQFSLLLFQSLARQADSARQLVSSRLSALNPEQLTGAGKELETRRRANLLILALKLDLQQNVWRWWQDSIDNSVRTQLTGSLAASQVDPAVLMRQLSHEEDASARAAMLIGLGHLIKDLSHQQTVALADQTADWFADDPASGMHGAFRWLIQNCLASPDSKLTDTQKTELLDRFDQVEIDLATGGPVGNRRWYVTRQGRHSLTIVAGPTDGWVGSTSDTAASRDPDELRRKRHVGRTFAIGQLEVTAAQFQKFWQQRPKLREFYGYPDDYYGHDDSPLALERVNWFVAADFCNWLSQQEGIPEDQWCFPRNVDRVNGITIPSDYFERTGYRLLSETEWELAARNGALTCWCFGSDGERLKEFAWWLDNSDERIHPPGMLRPNSLGLFDVYGNAMEWMVSGQQVDEQLVDDVLLHPVVNPLGSRILRGGGYSDFRGYVRSAYRESYTPDAGGIELGIRIGRTMPTADGG